MNRFEGKVVIVTGAGSGIGAATARRFLQEGAFVLLDRSLVDPDWREPVTRAGPLRKLRSTSSSECPRAHPDNQQ
jgi:NAD(P)-dependent dehydrogenase (short-subunit alcohol dehydrogenase family)